MTDHAALARSFQLIGAEYDRYRPSFPRPVVDLLVPAPVHGILDLGAGTGKLTELIADRAARVYAVDPSSRMLDVLRRKLPTVIAAVGSAEDIPLPDASVDIVVVAQAFHWRQRPRNSCRVSSCAMRSTWCGPRRSCAPTISGDGTP